MQELHTPSARSPLRLCALLAAFCAALLLLSGAKCNSGGSSSASAIPANYYAALQPSERLHWPTRTYAYCFVRPTLDPATNQELSIRTQIGNTVDGLNSLLASAAAKLHVNPGPPFAEVDVGVTVDGVPDTCPAPPAVLPGATADTSPIPGVAKFVAVPTIDGGNVGYTCPFTESPASQTLTATVTQILQSNNPLMLYGGKFENNRMMQTAGREVMHSFGSFGDLTEIPAASNGQTNIMAGKAAATATISLGDLVTLLLMYQDVPPAAATTRR